LNWRRGINFWHILLVAANCLLLVAIIQVWWGGGESPALSRSGKGPEVPKTPILRDAQSLNAFRVIQAKNLFSQDRSGPDSEVQTAKQDTLEGRKLLGTIIIGNERAAMIGGGGGGQPPGRAPQQPPQIEVVRLGEEWGGFKVVEISSDGVVFQGKDGRKTLNFPE
jgi:hypothetical protein